MIFPFGNYHLLALPASAQTIVFESGWENGEIHGDRDRIAYSKDVAGYYNSSSPPPESSRRYQETVRSGDFSLLMAGYSRNSYAYCYYHVFDMGVEVTAGMKIGYWILHQEGTAKVAVDGHFTDGSTIRDFGGGILTDQYGVSIHPAARRDPMYQWYYVEVDLSAAAGKTLDFILFGFDNGSDGFVERYRSYVDDFRIIADSDNNCIEAVSGDQWQGQYFNNMNLSGQPVMVRNDGAGFLDFDWGTGSPVSNCGVGVDHFSVHWSRDIEVNAGTYRFTVTSDDGFRLYIDNVLWLERWLDQGPTTYSVDVSLPAGNHTVGLEYYENEGGAMVRLSWEGIFDSCIAAVSHDRWQGEYFDDMDLAGSLLMIRDDGDGFLNFDWGSGSPSSQCGVGADHFSVNWKRQIEFIGGTHRFTVTSDDGFRLYIDDVLMLERWFVQSPTTYSLDVSLAAGSHTVELEYYEDYGGAVARLTWEEIIEDIPGSLASLNLVWDANKEADLAGYRLYYGTASKEYTQMIDVGNVTEFRLDQLQKGMAYYLALTAYDFDGNESDFSKEASGVPIR
jgi:hypothetical protein